MSPRLFFTTIILLLALLPVGRASSAATTQGASGAPRVTVTVDRSTVIALSRLETGVTHTRHSLDAWNNAYAVARGRSLLMDSTTFQNQYTYGWGTVNPEPSPGHFDWISLDERVAMMRSMHATMVLTLCCAPDWMTSIGRDTSTYSQLAPTPAHYRDFAELARRIALRYPDVHYYQVWSEMRGFFVQGILNWDVVAYTRLYNDVYDALKSVNPNLQVGGPYIMIEGTGTHLGHWSQLDPPLPRNLSVIDYWLAHKHGADFISLKRNAKGDHDPLTYPTAEVMGFTAQFEEIAHKIRQRTSLRIWWSENFFGPGGWHMQAAGLASVMYHELLAGSRVSLLWSPEGTRGGEDNGNQQSLYSDTRYPGGGRPFPFYHAFRAFHLDFGPGTKIYRTRSSVPFVLALASGSHVMLINQRPFGVTVHILGQTVPLPLYGVKIVDG